MAAPLVPSSAELPPLYTEGVEVRHLPNRGDTAFATRDFTTGEIILCEGPALIITAGKENSFRDEGMLPFFRFSREHDADWDFWATLRPLSLLSSESLDKLRTTLYSPLTPPVTESASSTLSLASVSIPTDSLGMPVVSSEASLCAKLFATTNDETFRALFPPSECPDYDYWSSIRERIRNDISNGVSAVRSSAVFEVLQLLHGCRINFHTNESSGLKCIFPNCCKLSHNCNPNTFWRMVTVREDGEDEMRRAGLKDMDQKDERRPFSSSLVGAKSRGYPLRDIRALHIATRPIRKGEELSFSYAGTGLNMMADTSRRRDALFPLGFVCRCDRCAEYDNGKETCRSLRCLECGTASSVRLLPLEGVWACSNRDEELADGICPFSLTPREMVDVGALLEAETLCELVVMRVMFGGKGGAGGGAGGDEEYSSGSSCAADSIFDKASRHTRLGPIVRSVFGVAHPIIRRWNVVEAAEVLVGPSHYLFAVSFMGFLRALAAAVEAPQAIRDFTTFVGERRKHFALEAERLKASSTGQTHQTFLDYVINHWLCLAEEWFRANMPLGTQHYKLWHLISDICTAIANKRPIPLSEVEVSAAKGLVTPQDILEGLEKLSPFDEWRT